MEQRCLDLVSPTSANSDEGRRCNHVENTASKRVSGEGDADRHSSTTDDAGTAVDSERRRPSDITSTTRQPEHIAKRSVNFSRHKCMLTYSTVSLVPPTMDVYRGIT